MIEFVLHVRFHCFEYKYATNESDQNTRRMANNTLEP